MDADIVLHIGAGKAGSSTIHAFLRRNHTKLAAHGLVVLDRELGLDGTVTGEHVWKLQSLIDNDDESGLCAALDRAVQTVGGGRSVLISAENLSNPGYHRYFRRIGETHKVRAILYIRRQDEYLMSCWQQWHCKIESDLNAWLIRALPRFGMWERIIHEWESVLGPGNVEVRIFERSAMKDGNLLVDFLDPLGLTSFRDEFDFRVDQVNQSLSDVVTPLIMGGRVCKGIHDNEYYRFVRAVTGDSYTTGPKVSLITRGQRESIVGFYRDMNQRVCASYFPGRKRLFEPIDHGKYLYLDEGQLLQRQLQYLNDLIFRTYQSMKGN